MPLYRIVTTTISYLDIDLSKEDDREAFEEAVGEDGEIDTDVLVDLLSDSIVSAHENLGGIGEAIKTTINLAPPEEVKVLNEQQ